MKRYLLVLLAISLFISNVQAQYWNKDYSSRYFVGGTAGLMLGTVTNIEVTPMVGVNLLPRLSIGTAFIYQYFNDQRYNEQANVFGGRFFSEFVALNNIYDYIPIRLFDNIFLHGEYEYLSIGADYYNLYTGNHESANIDLNSIIYGIGFGLPMGPKSSLKISVLANATLEAIYPQDPPILRMDMQFYFRKPIAKKYKQGME